VADKTDAKRNRSPHIENRRARHDYFIDDSFETGVELQGPEVKSIREGSASLQDSYCEIRGGELWLQNMYVKPYLQGNRWNPDERRPRKLLAHHQEILRLQQKVQEKGVTLVPLKLYFARGWVKLEVGVARGKRQFDKREAIRARDIERDARREDT